MQLFPINYPLVKYLVERDMVRLNWKRKEKKKKRKKRKKKEWEIIKRSLHLGVKNENWINPIKMAFVTISHTKVQWLDGWMSEWVAQRAILVKIMQK